LVSRQLKSARLEVIVADITTLRVDAIVNAANAARLATRKSLPDIGYRPGT
jgi:hypothetical protein